MFGNNKPFGSATPFGGTSFGSTTPFGQTSTAFGAKPATSNVFGASTFGVTNQNTGNLFGASTQPTGSGLFGQQTSTFGTPASTSTGTFGFGGTSSSAGLFGSTTPSTQSSSGLFGGSASAFGTPRPAFGGFGTTTTGTGLFGQNTSTGTSLFGSSGGFSATATTGTTIKFNPPTGTDTMMKGGVSTSIGTRHQCITCMKEYENKSLEELRVEDYAANRKGGSAGGITFGSTTPQTGLFGSTPAASTSGFSFGNTTQTKPLFGSTGNTNAFGSTSLFGQPAQNQNTGLFGKSVGFGTATTSAGQVFNFGSSTGTMGTGTSLFGQNNQQKPLFGGTTGSTSLFGTPATTQTTAFGTTPAFGGFGATNQQSTNLFGAKPTGFGTTSTTTTNSFSFGNTNMSGGLFGQKTAAPTFGSTAPFGTQTPGFGGFGSTSTTGTGLFGQNKPATSVFGSTGNTFGSGLGNAFGSSTFGSSLGGLGTNTGTGLFGTSTANKAPGFNFGGTGNSSFSFGGPSNPSSSFNFNQSSSLLGGNDPNNAAALQQAQQQILAMTANPFGDSPLFRNSLKDASRESEVLKPTNPSAQKALLNDNQYKVALLPTAKIKPKPWTPSPSGKNFLFDGLEDEEPNLGNAAFLPKRSVKKLVLKNLGTNRSTVTFTSDISGACDQNTRIDVSISMNKSNNPSSKMFTDTSPNAVPLTVDISDTSLKNIYNDSDVAITVPKKILDTSKSPSEESLSIPDAPLGSSIDDSIVALHTNKQVPRGRTFNVLSESEEDDGERNLTSKEVQNTSIGSSDDSGQITTNKTGIILTRSDYVTIPSIEDLPRSMDENGNCYVENFTIIRIGYGRVTFPGVMNVAGLNLDEIVHFGKKEINVYPYDDKKPPVGEGLNRKAIVTLEKVWPTDKTTHTPITDPERLIKMGYRDKIEKSTSRLGAKFIDYVHETGSWTFQVDHFSKYGLEDSDEEMDVSKPSENDKSKVPPKQLELNGKGPKGDMTQKQVLKRRPISSMAAVEDDEMEVLSFPLNTPNEFLFTEGDEFTNEVYSPTRPLFSTDLDAERIQGMKASFFQEEMDEDNWTASIYPPENDAMFKFRKDTESKPYSPVLRTTTLNGTMSNLNKKQRYFDYENEPAYLSPVPPVKPLDAGMQGSMSLSTAKQDEWVSSFPLVKSIPQPTTYVDRTVLPLNKIRLIPFERSVLSGKSHLLADAGYFMGRSFRAGWKSDGMIVTLPPPTESEVYSESLPKFLLFGDNTSFSSKSNKKSGFTLSLKKINVSTLDYTDKHMESLQNNLVEVLKLQLENSVSTLEGDSPLFVPKPGVELIHSHAVLFETHLKDSVVADYDNIYISQSVHVWNLLVALWGKIKGLNDDQTISSYAQQMARRDALSAWLIKALENIVLKEIASLSQDSYLSKIFLYLSCRRISDAVKLAQNHQDFRLSLLLSQAEGTAMVRKWMSRQLLNWEQNGAYKFIKYDRILLYAILAGLMIWENAYETVNCCKDLDWKQTLALHLWYHCEPNASIQVAVEEYDKSFQGCDKATKYALPPYPLYKSALDTNKEMLEDQDSRSSEQVYDTCYHLLKLFCNQAHRLDQLLMPLTYTDDPLDYRLSWLLHLALTSIGFNIPADVSSTLHMNFASQLESIDMWHWAVFVYLHHPNKEWRTKNVKDILLRHVTLDQDKDNEEREKFVKEHLLVPEKWIFEAKAVKAYSSGKHAERAWYLLKAGSWNKSHTIIIKHLAADAVINEDYDYLMKYLSELALPERSSTISDWSSGGQVYLDYINMCQVVQGVISSGGASAYDLEKFTPEVLSLCSRLSSIPTPTIKDRLSVAEMAKKTATIMRSIAILQAERTKNNSSLISLASYFKNLPMPHDYAVSENRFIAHCFLKEVTSGTQATY